jgi:hypothetical protein
MRKLNLGKKVPHGFEQFEQAWATQKHKNNRDKIRSYTKRVFLNMAISS